VPDDWQNLVQLWIRVSDQLRRNMERMARIWYSGIDDYSRSSGSGGVVSVAEFKTYLKIQNSEEYNTFLSE
jgi:hypothetical protein